MKQDENRMRNGNRAISLYFYIISIIGKKYSIFNNLKCNNYFKIESKFEFS